MRFLGTPVGRRCAVVRCKGGELVVFSPVKADRQSIAQLRSLGKVAAFILPSRFHDRYYEDYFQIFSDARFLASRAVMEDHPKWPLTELIPGVPELSEFDFTELKGMPWVREVLFHHRVSKTLMIADALFNVPLASGVLDRVLMRFADIGGEPKVCRLFRLMIRDKAALRASLRQVLEWDFVRIVPGHGEVVEQNGKETMTRAYRRYLL